MKLEIDGYDLLIGVNYVRVKQGDKQVAIFFNKMNTHIISRVGDEKKTLIQDIRG